MNVKYQVFVSSTYDDLRKEREQVIKAVLEMGHIPVGMEMFSAADEEQWKLIARQIEQADYYVVIVAHRYGSVVDGLSYTEKEYDYAVLKGIPVLGFIIDESAPWPADRMEVDLTKKCALDQFKAKLRSKPVGLWTTSEDLYGKFSIALIKLITTTPRTGWAPASQVISPEVMIELSRLSRENAQLRHVVDAKTSKEEAVAAREKTLRTLARNTIKVKIWYQGMKDWDETEVLESTLHRLFDYLGPELAVEKSVEGSASFIALMFNRDDTRKPKHVPYNTLKGWFSDLMTLGLVEPSRKRHPVSDKAEYWALTEEGRETLQLLRKSRLELGEEPTTEVEPERPEDKPSNCSQKAPA